MHPLIEEFRKSYIKQSGSCSIEKNVSRRAQPAPDQGQTPARSSPSAEGDGLFRDRHILEQHAHRATLHDLALVALSEHRIEQALSVRTLLLCHLTSLWNTL